jgi:hypothetical protein
MGLPSLPNPHFARFTEVSRIRRGWRPVYRLTPPSPAPSRTSRVPQPSMRLSAGSSKPICRITTRRLLVHVSAPVRRPGRLPLLAVLDETRRRSDGVSDLSTALGIAGARWALLIVEQLLDGPQRYGDLERELRLGTNVLATRARARRGRSPAPSAAPTQHQCLRIDGPWARTSGDDGHAQEVGCRGHGADVTARQSPGRSD